jgi:hypothetical protein
VPDDACRSRTPDDSDRVIGQLVVLETEVAMQRNGHLAFAPRA